MLSAYLKVTTGHECYGIELSSEQGSRFFSYWYYKRMSICFIDAWESQTSSKIIAKCGLTYISFFTCQLFCSYTNLVAGLFRIVTSAVLQDTACYKLPWLLGQSLQSNFFLQSNRALNLISIKKNQKCLHF